MCHHKQLQLSVDWHYSMRSAGLCFVHSASKLHLGPAGLFVRVPPAPVRAASRVASMSTVATDLMASKGQSWWDCECGVLVWCPAVVIGSTRVPLSEVVASHEKWGSKRQLQLSANKTGAPGRATDIVVEAQLFLARVSCRCCTPNTAAAVLAPSANSLLQLAAYC
jgi:hypothetical protein